MINFDSTTGKFRDSKTGRLRSDLAGLLSANARRQYKEFAGNIDLEEYRSNLGKKYYKPHETLLVKKIQKLKPGKSHKKRGVFEITDFTDFDDYINDWLEDFDFVLEEEDTDLETP